MRGGTVTTVDACARGRSNRRRGADAERAVVNWLRRNGWPGAERAIRTAYTTADRTVADPGDITGTPRLAWQVKDAAAERITTWMADTAQQAATSGADYGILVVRRRGRASPGDWWAWMWAADIVRIYTGEDTGPAGEFPVRTELGALVGLLHEAGFGDPEVIDA
jgi:hypothetical protein